MSLIGLWRGVRQAFLLVLAATAATAWANRPAFSEIVLFDTLSDVGQRYYYRIPAIVTINRPGVVVAFAEERVGDNDDWGDINVVYRYSTDHGATWSPIRRVCELGPATCGNPTAVVDQNTGTLHLFLVSSPQGVCQSRFQIGKNDCERNYSVGERRIRYVTGQFDGETMVFDAKGDDIADLTNDLQLPWMRFDLIGPGVGIQLTDPQAGFAGRLLVPALGRTFISDDGGSSWRLAFGTMSHASSEPAIVELDDGTVLRNDRVTRSERGDYPSRLLSFSDTGGEYFPAFTYQRLPVPDPAAQGAMLRYAEGHLLFSNCASSTHRRYLTIRKTTNGRDWSHGRRIDEGCGYSSLTKTRDFHVAVLYERPAPGHRSNDQGPLDLIFRKFKLSHFDD